MTTRCQDCKRWTPPNTEHPAGFCRLWFEHCGKDDSCRLATRWTRPPPCWDHDQLKLWPEPPTTALNELGRWCAALLTWALDDATGVNPRTHYDSRRHKRIADADNKNNAQEQKPQTP